MKCITCFKVPNAPCGVESCKGDREGEGVVLFLMHRVELKAQRLLLS